MSEPAEERKPGPGPEHEEAPPLFLVLCGSLAAQVQMALGLIQDPVEGKANVDLESARQGIELLGMLEAKTKGNLDDREARTLGDLLAYVRMLYVERVKQLAERSAGGGTPPPAPTPS